MHGKHGSPHGRGTGCGHGPGYGACHCGRHFLTKEEKLEHLEYYKEWLDNESKGVAEAIEGLKK